MGRTESPKRGTVDLSNPPTTVAIHGLIVRRLRLERELSIGELAEAVEVGTPYITKIERGHSLRVSIAVFRKMRAALGIPYDERRLLLANPFGDADPEPCEAVA